MHTGLRVYKKLIAIQVPSNPARAAPVGKNTEQFVNCHTIQQQHRPLNGFVDFIINCGVIWLRFYAVTTVCSFVV